MCAPFVWTADPERILDTVVRGTQALAFVEEVQANVLIVTISCMRKKKLA